MWSLRTGDTLSLTCGPNDRIRSLHTANRAKLPRYVYHPRLTLSDLTSRFRLPSSSPPPFFFFPSHHRFHSHFPP